MIVGIHVIVLVSGTTPCISVAIIRSTAETPYSVCRTAAWDPISRAATAAPPNANRVNVSVCRNVYVLYRIMRVNPTNAPRFPVAIITISVNPTSASQNVFIATFLA